MSDLRDIADAFKAQSKSLSKIESDMTDSARALEEMSKAVVQLTEGVEPLEEMQATLQEISRSLKALPDVVKTIGTLTTEVISLGTRLNTYVDSTAAQNGGLRARMTALELRFGER